jgi:hypothetical protein
LKSPSSKQLNYHLNNRLFLKCKIKCFLPTFRKRHGKSSSDSSEEEPTVIKSKREKPRESKKKKDSSSEDEFEKMERERTEDLKGRDDFAKRLKDKDKSKTRNIVSKSGKFYTIRNGFHFVPIIPANTGPTIA